MATTRTQSPGMAHAELQALTAWFFVLLSVLTALGLWYAGVSYVL